VSSAHINSKKLKAPYHHEYGHAQIKLAEELFLQFLALIFGPIDGTTLIVFSTQLIFDYYWLLHGLLPSIFTEKHACRYVEIVGYSLRFCCELQLHGEVRGGKRLL
jgi:hypothetical protein